MEKEYKSITKSAEEFNSTFTGYFETEDGNHACDSRRLYWEGPAEQMPEKFQKLIPQDREPQPFELDTPLLGFLKLAAKRHKVGRPSGNTPHPLILNGNYTFSCEAHVSNEFGEIDKAIFTRTPPVSFLEGLGVNPKFLMDALKFVTRSKPAKKTVTISAGESEASPLVIEMGERHALLMLTKI